MRTKPAMVQFNETRAEVQNLYFKVIYDTTTARSSHEVIRCFGRELTTQIFLSNQRGQNILKLLFEMLQPDDSLPFYEWKAGDRDRKWGSCPLYGNLTLVSNASINFSEEDFRWCVMAVAW